MHPFWIFMDWLMVVVLLWRADYSLFTAIQIGQLCECLIHFTLPLWYTFDSYINIPLDTTAALHAKPIARFVGFFVVIAKLWMYADINSYADITASPAYHVKFWLNNIFILCVIFER